MMMAMAGAAWEQYDAISASQLGHILLRMTALANPATLRKHSRGPKLSKKKAYVCAAVARRHVQRRALKEGRVN
jgi:hypothetical protein